MRYLRRNISTWGQSEKYIEAWIHFIMNKSIQAPGRHTFLMLHRPPTFAASASPTKKSIYSKNFIQLDSLLSYLLHNICMWHAGLLHCKKLKPVLVQLKQHHPVLRASMSYKLKYSPFEYFTNYDANKYESA